MNNPKEREDNIKMIRHEMAVMAPSAWIELLAEREKKLREALARNPRVEKVLLSGKGFLIITSTEPYFGEAYNMIREQEIAQGTWTHGDQLLFGELMREFELNMLKGETNE